MKKVAGENPFCVLIYLNSYIFHICFILFILLSNTYLIFDFMCLTLSLADIKYASTYIRRYENAHTNIHKKVEKVEGKRKKGKKEGV